MRGFTQCFKEDFIMKRLVSLLGVLVLSCFVLASLSLAQHSHGGMSMGTSMKMDTKEVIVEGVKVTFQIMENDEHQKMLKDMKMKEDIEPGTTHNFTVILKDAKTQQEVANAQITMKVIDPKGQDQIKPLKYEEEMKSYDAYFKLSEKGKYQVIILFKVGEQKRTAGIYYEIK
jgi:C4-type Zn-finger protein